MNCLLIVNESPWQSGLPLAALRFARAAEARGLHIAAVFFREEGVYHALAGTSAEAGSPDLQQEWREISTQHGTRLMVCSASGQRRLPPGSAVPPFVETGLADMLEEMQSAARLVTF